MKDVRAGLASAERMEAVEAALPKLAEAERLDKLDAAVRPNPHAWPVPAGSGS